MSWEATAWAKKTRGHRSAGAKLVLMMLADYHSRQDGYAWPSQTMLAEDTELSVRTVRWCLDTLQSQGFIKMVQKGNQYHPTKYLLNFAGTQSYEPANSEPAIFAAASEPAMDDKVKRQFP